MDPTPPPPPPSLCPLKYLKMGLQHKQNRKNTLTRRKVEHQKYCCITPGQPTTFFVGIVNFNVVQSSFTFSGTCFWTNTRNKTGHQGPCGLPSKNTFFWQHLWKVHPLRATAVFFYRLFWQRFRPFHLLINSAFQLHTRMWWRCGRRARGGLSWCCRDLVSYCTLRHYCSGGIFPSVQCCSFLVSNI